MPTPLGVEYFFCGLQVARCVGEHLMDRVIRQVFFEQNLDNGPNRSSSVWVDFRAHIVNLPQQKPLPPKPNSAS